MTYYDAAKELGLHTNYFHTLKTNCPSKFKYIFGNTSKNKIELWNNYINEMISVKRKSEEMYFELQDERKIRNFGVYLVSIGLYTNLNSFGSGITKTLFDSHDGFSTHRAFIKYKKILKAYEDYKEKR